MLKNIDRKGYPAYKGTYGIYDFGNYYLSIDHVQGDPFASPSKLSIEVKGKKAGFPAEFYNAKYKRIALCDHLTRLFYNALSKISFRAKGSGKSGLFSISKCGQEVLERTACTINPSNGDISIHFEAGFPANGRTVNGRELSKMLFDLLPSCAISSLFYKNIDQKALKSAIDLSEDQYNIRTKLDSMGLVAFIADGSILPRESGVSQRPMKHCVAFKSPDSYRVSFDLPHHGKITGMGIPKGITLIVGGGYHGKSTLLKALELGVYDHIKGDGREFVITDPTAMKIRAEDGGVGSNNDGFINKLKSWWTNGIVGKLIIIFSALVVVIVITLVIILTVNHRQKKKRKIDRHRKNAQITNNNDVGMDNGHNYNSSMDVQIEVIGRKPDVKNVHINGSAFIGRANTCDVFINEVTVSRQHIVLECKNGELFVQPLMTATNSTKLNGKQITDRHQLFSGDRLMIGAVGIIVRW